MVPRYSIHKNLLSSWSYLRDHYCLSNSKNLAVHQNYLYVNDKRLKHFACSSCSRFWFNSLFQFHCGRYISSRCCNCTHHNGFVLPLLLGFCSESDSLNWWTNSNTPIKIYISWFKSISQCHNISCKNFLSKLSLLRWRENKGLNDP